MYIPYSKFDQSIGRNSTTIHFVLTKGRDPEKCIKLILNLLKNTKSLKLKN